MDFFKWAHHIFTAMKRSVMMVLVGLMATVSLNAQTDLTFATRQIPVNRGGEEDSIISLRFYDDLPSVAYISVADFQQLMLPGTTIGVTKTGEGEYTLTGPYAEATVNITTDQFTSDDYMAFTNLMGQIQEDMDNVYSDGSPFIRYRNQELIPASATVTFDFKKYGIDLRGDDSAVYFPLSTLSDLYSDLYYHIAAYNGEKVIVVTDNNNSNIVRLDTENTINVLKSESRNSDMAAFSYSELCFVIDHFYGMPGRSPLEEAIQADGLDKALDNHKDGPTIKKLLKSTSMKEYIFGLNCLHVLLGDGGHTNLRVDYLIYDILAEDEVDDEEDKGVEEDAEVEEGDNEWQMAIEEMEDEYPELAKAVLQYEHELLDIPYDMINSVRPTEGTYYKEGDTAYLLYNSFGSTNYDDWNDYYDNGCTGTIPAFDEDHLGDINVVIDALQRANDDPEVKNFVVDLTLNPGGSLDEVIAMTALMGGQTHFYSENVLTGQRQIIYYDVDCNFDGQFNELDKEVKYDLNFAVLTSSISFSCGNLFPSLMKDMGFPIIGEKSGGGSCAIQNHATPEGLQYQISSARARLTDKQWKNIDEGVEPTHVLDTSEGYLDFYNLATISEIVKAGTIPTDIRTFSLSADDKWYALDGRRLSGKPTAKGLYICEGKKVMIK